VNFRGQGQKSSQGQMINVTYFKTKLSVILIATTFYVQLEHIQLIHALAHVRNHLHFEL